MPALDDLVLPAALLWRHGLLQRRDRWSRTQLAAHQAQALRGLRAYAYARAPFYRQFHAGRQGAPLHELPVLTKAVLMEHFDDLVTDPAVHLADLVQHVATLQGDAQFRGRYWVNATSGTTGRRGIFLFDRREWVDFLASWMHGQAWTGGRLNPFHLRLALVASTVPWHMSARVGASFGRWARALRLDAAQPIAALDRDLNAFQPQILVAYPTIVGVLAAEHVAGRLRIAPQTIFTSAEVLTERTRQLVEGAWGKRLFDQYAATECGGLAAECEQHQGLHLFEDRVICEAVDGDGRPVPPGTYGQRLLITVLGSRTLPLIRYELDDSVRVRATPCPCGRPFALIDGVQGKTHEVLVFPDVAGGRVAVNPLVFHRLMDTQPVEGWQVSQEPAGLRIRVCRPGADFAPHLLEEATREALRAQGVLVPPVGVEEVTSIPRGATGKVALVTSQMAMPETAGRH